MWWARKRCNLCGGPGRGVTYVVGQEVVETHRERLTRLESPFLFNIL